MGKYSDMLLAPAAPEPAPAPVPGADQAAPSRRSYSDMLLGSNAPQESPGTAAPEKSTWSQIDDTVRAIASGATLGYADEIAAALNTVTGLGEGKTYAENVKTERARDAAIPAAIDVPAEIAGSVASAAVTGSLAAGTGLARAAARLPGWVQSTGLGALWGAAYGSGNANPDPALDLGESAKKRATGAGIGAALGGVTGGAVHGTGKLAGGAVKKVTSFALSRTKPAIQAARALGNKIEQDGITPSRIMARLRQLGPHATLADAAGPNVQGLLRGLAGEPGAPKTRIMQALSNRASGESERVSNEVTKYLGPGDYFSSEEVFLKKLQDGARDAYQKAYEANPVVASKRLDRILTSWIGKRALHEASIIADTERAAGKSKYLGPVDKELTDAARYAASVGKMEKVERPGVAKGLSLETWDYVKRGIDSLLDKPAYRNELTGKLNKKGYAIDQLRKALVRGLDKATGGDQSLYAAARKQYGGDAETLTALRNGAKFFKMSPELIKREMEKMSIASREAYRNGAARAILDIIENTPDNASVSRRLFNKTMTRKKIAAVFPSHGAFRNFARRMVAEQRFRETEQAITSGSRTAPMQAEMAETKGAVGALGAVLGTKVPGVHPLVGSGIGRRYVQKMFGRPDKMNNILARWLTTKNINDQIKILELITPHAVPAAKGSPLIGGATIGITQQEIKARQGSQE